MTSAATTTTATTPTTATAIATTLQLQLQLQLQVQLQLQLQLHYSYNYNYNYTTPHYIQELWVRWPLQPLPKSTAPITFRSISGFALPSTRQTTHLSYSVLSLKLPPPPCAVLLVCRVAVATVFGCCTVQKAKSSTLEGDCLLPRQAGLAVYGHWRIWWRGRTEKQKGQGCEQSPVISLTGLGYSDLTGKSLPCELRVLVL